MTENYLAFLETLQANGGVIPDTVKALLEQAQAALDADAHAKARKAELDEMAESISGLLQQEAFVLRTGERIVLVGEEYEEGEGEAKTKATRIVVKAEVSTPRAHSNGNGSGKPFGGGGGTKVHGPFKDAKTGVVYKNWPEIALNVLGHTAHEGNCDGKCGYWKKVTDARKAEPGRFIPIS